MPACGNRFEEITEYEYNFHNIKQNYQNIYVPGKIKF
jgi:hypothetical protein